MKKFCIFCGEKPVDKNLEHVIPQWLIRMTGNPNRVSRIGKKDGKDIRFPWMNYVFPACSECNTDFSFLEAKAKPIVEKLLNQKSVTHIEINLFLDWVDKVRTGVWLGHAMLYKLDFTPNFYINQRVAAKDRMCILYKIDDNELGISLIGVQTSIFLHTPSCFGLVINNLVIFNYSCDFMLGKNLGFPYPEKYTYIKDLLISIENILPGTANITSPLMQGKIVKPSVKFYQAILKGLHGLKRPQLGPAKKYINENCLTFTNTEITSRILISDDLKSKQQFWRMNEVNTFSFPREFERRSMHMALAKMVLEHQIQSIEDVLQRLDISDEEERAGVESYFRTIISDNRTLLTGIDVVVEPLIVNI